MAVTRKGRSLIMTAANDVAGQNAVRCRQIRFVGVTLTAGQELVIKEVDTNGAVIADHIITAATEDVVIWEAGGMKGGWIRKPFIDAYPAAGTSKVLFQLE